jgi:Predicted membrane protein
MEENTNNAENEVVKASTSEYTKEDKEKNKVMAILSYLGILAFVAYFVGAKDSKWVKFHAVQGVNLAIVSLGAMIVLNVLNIVFAIIFSGVLETLFGLVLTLLIGAVGLGTFVFMLLGILNVLKGEAKKLPLISKIKILK